MGDTVAPGSDAQLRLLHTAGWRIGGEKEQEVAEKQKGEGEEEKKGQDTRHR